MSPYLSRCRGAADISMAKKSRLVLNARCERDQQGMMETALNRLASTINCREQINPCNLHCHWVQPSQYRHLRVVLEPSISVFFDRRYNMAKTKPFSVKYGWKDFDNTSELTSFQKHTIRDLYEDRVKAAIQKIINQSVKDRAARRKELDAHKDMKNPFDLDIGGQG